MSNLLDVLKGMKVVSCSKSQEILAHYTNRKDRYINQKIKMSQLHSLNLQRSHTAEQIINFNDSKRVMSPCPLWELPIIWEDNLDSIIGSETGVVLFTEPLLDDVASGHWLYLSATDGRKMIYAIDLTDYHWCTDQWFIHLNHESAGFLA